MKGLLKKKNETDSQQQQVDSNNSSKLKFEQETTPVIFLFIHS